MGVAGFTGEDREAAPIRAANPPYLRRISSVPMASPSAKQA
jgi:hypothetical protein